MISKLGDFAARSFHSIFRGAQRPDAGQPPGAGRGCWGTGDTFERMRPGSPGAMRKAYTTTKPTLLPPGDTKSTSAFSKTFDRMKERWGGLGEFIKGGFAKVMAMFQEKSTTKPILPPTDPNRLDGGMM